jgi:hypothetical protein
MTMLKLASVAVAAVAALSLSAAYAVDSGGVNIKGNTNVIGVAKDVATVAIGKGNVACTEIGAIGDNPACKK